MPTWGGRWGERWGCPAPGENPYLLLCRDLTWKQAERWPNHRLVCEIAAEQAFEAHREAERVELRFGVSGGAGDELDAWGAAVDFPRFGAHDTLYKKALRASGRSLLGSGDPATFHDVIATINPTALVSLAELFPACVRLFFTDITENEQRIILGLLEHVPGLGICVQSVLTFGGEVFVWGHTDGDVPVPFHWGYANSPGIPEDETAGWALILTL